MVRTLQYNLYEPHIDDLRTQAYLHQTYSNLEQADMTTESRHRSIPRALLTKMGLVSNQEHDSSIEPHSLPVLHL